jgi:hypothetical protein
MNYAIEVGSGAMIPNSKVEGEGRITDTKRMESA